MIYYQVSVFHYYLPLVLSGIRGGGGGGRFTICCCSSGSLVIIRFDFVFPRNEFICWNYQSIISNNQSVLNKSILYYLEPHPLPALVQDLWSFFRCLNTFDFLMSSLVLAGGDREHLLPGKILHSVCVARSE